VGVHLVRHLLSRGHEVFAGVHRTTAGLPKGAATVALDLLDLYTLREALSKVRPQAVVHLAAQSKVATSWEQPAQTFAVNLLGTINLLEAVSDEVPDSRVLTVGSGEEYGLTAASGERLTEEHPCRPHNPYALSKFAMGQVALQLALRKKLRVVHVRPFNHFGPGQQEGYLVSDLAAQIARAEAGLQPPVITVGDLAPRRDFTYVQDVVEAYAGLVEREVPNGVYNVCSGVARAVKEVVETLLSEARIPLQVVSDPTRFRLAEIQVFVGSAEKLKGLTGWQPQRGFLQGLRETLEWWREKVRTGQG
jgi:GDP-4-dehydro-6-deoxy-D-mannose reductase